MMIMARLKLTIVFKIKIAIKMKTLMMKRMMVM